MFSYLQNLFNLTESAAKDALVAGWLVILVFTAIITRFSIKAIIGVVVIGMIVMGVANNSDFIKKGGDSTVKEIKNGTTTGLRAPLRPGTEHLTQVAASRAA
jgi:hypothetical protein